MRRGPALVTDSCGQGNTRGRPLALPDLPHQTALLATIMLVLQPFAGRLPLFFLPFIAVAGSYS